MSLSLSETQAIHAMAGHLYNFLPGSTYRENTQSLTFGAAASRAGVGHLWRSGSKLPALIGLLEGTLDKHRQLFCPLIMDIVRSSLAYHSGHLNPLAYEDIKTLNDLLLQIHFRIPELWDTHFLDSLPRKNKPTTPKQSQEGTTRPSLDDLKNQLVRLQAMDPVQRGFAFERFLQDFFGASELAPRGSFRLVGEQIDGSCEITGETYLIEAKWQNEPVGQNELLAFSGKVGGKSAWSRGLFISHSGFTSDGMQAFARGRATNIVGISGQDLYLILDGVRSLPKVITEKARRAAESGEFYVPVLDLAPG